MAAALALAPSPQNTSRAAASPPTGKPWRGYALLVWLSLLPAILVLVPMVGYLFGEGVPRWLADKDFANYWVAAKLAATGQAGDVFGPWDGYWRHLQAAMGPDFPWHNWSYPPHYLLLMMPLALVGYKAGLVLFLLVTFAVFAGGVRVFAGVEWRFALLAASPFVALNAWTAQNGFLLGGLMLLMLGWRERRPVLAGLMLGLLTVKPQLGLLVPILLLVERRWLVTAVGSAFALALALLSAAAFGMGAWTAFVTTILPYQSRVMAGLEGTFLWMVPSVFGALRLLNIPAPAALGLHLCVAVPALALTAWTFVRVQDAQLRACVLAVATFVVAPYALNYDLGFFAVALGVFVARMRPEFAGERWLFALAFTLPVLMMVVGRFGVQPAPLVILPVFAVMLWRLHAGMPGVSDDNSGLPGAIARPM